MNGQESKRLTSDKGDLVIAVAAEIVGKFVPGAGVLTQRALEAARAEWARNQSLAMAAACRSAGMSREDLDQTMEENPELLPLVTRLLWQAAATGERDLLEAMGAIFGSTALSRTPVDECDGILKSLDALHAVDINVLRWLSSSERVVSVDDSDEDDGADYTSVSLAERLGTDNDRVNGSLARLVGQGFAISRSVLGGDRFTITTTGRVLCEALSQVVAQEGR